MGKASIRILRRVVALVIGVQLFVLPAPAEAVELQQATVDAFDRYVRISEAQIDAELARDTPFLWVDSLPDGHRESAYVRLKAGQMVIERLETLEEGKRITVPHGLIHHWIGTVFVPGATLADTIALLQDYDHHQDYYKPDMRRSKILRHDGNDFLVYLRFYKKKVLTSVLDTEHEIHYNPVSSTRVWSRSRTSRVQEVEDAGESDEHVNPVGHDRGFLWRMNTYWRFEQKDGGTYVECQSISLTRDVPTGLGWLIGSYVESIPRESLTFTLGTTRSTLLGRKHAATTP